MAGTLKVGGKVLATHSGVEGVGEVTLQNATLDSGVVFPAGHVIQVVSHTKTNKQLCNSAVNTFTEQDPDFRVEITPKNDSSKFLVYLVINGGATTGCPRFRIEYSTNNGLNWSNVEPVGDLDGDKTRSHTSMNINGDGNSMNSCSIEVLFQPATSSTMLFRVMMGGDQPNYMMWNGSINNLNIFLGNTMTSTLRVTELSG